MYQKEMTTNLNINDYDYQASKIIIHIMMQQTSSRINLRVSNQDTS